RRSGYASWSSGNRPTLCANPAQRFGPFRSNDPVCADNGPDDRSGDRATHGAARHGCLLIAETSCEMRNLFLDRNLLMPTMATDGAAIFAFREHRQANSEV